MTAGSWSRRGPRSAEASAENGATTGIARMGGTGLEPLPPNYDIGRREAPRYDKRAAYAAFFTAKGRVVTPRGVSWRNGLGGLE